MGPIQGHPVGWARRVTSVSRSAARFVSGLVAVAVLVAWACSGTGRLPEATTPPAAPAPTGSAVLLDASCAAGRPMTLHFYDVAQALSVLVDLPDGRHVLVDAADEPRREGCGDVCSRAQAHLIEQLRADLHGAPLDMVWITHQHSDHIGGVPEVLASVPAALYVDNGRDGRKLEVRRAREAAAAHGAQVRVVDPSHPDPPLRGSPNVALLPVVPARWPRACREDENECSIALRIDYCRSSVLLTGDAEHEEEKLLDPGQPVTLLQVGHHGSETSTSPAFLSRVRPKYAVISAGKPDEGTNRDYCHPRASIVQRLSQVLDADGATAGASDAGPGDGGGATDPKRATLVAFGGARCDRATPGDWTAVPSSDRLWATERDGDVVLVTTGDGVFRRVGR